MFSAVRQDDSLLKDTLTLLEKAGDPAGADCRTLGHAEVAELAGVLAAGGLTTISLRQRYSVVFVFPGIGVGARYPELAGCTAELSTFADEAANFTRQGVQLVGLTMQPAAPDGDFFTAFPFPLGYLPADVGRQLVTIISRGTQQFAQRTSFIIYPDGTGLQITDIQDSAAHVRKCFDLIVAHRLATYHRAVAAHLQQATTAVRSALELREFLPNGADSVSIYRLDLRAELVCKLSDPQIIAAEAGYMQEINQLMAEHCYAPLFPTIVAIHADQHPGWYLMEAVNPITLDQVVFADEARTRLKLERRHLLIDALSKLANLHRTTFRRECPKAARYHYHRRFLELPLRPDFRSTFQFLFRDEIALPQVLDTPLRLTDGLICRPYNEQVTFLTEHLDDLLQPLGAYLHGDTHLPNMLLGRDNQQVVFIDPRTVWDGNNVGDPGFGDPLYDYGTLLHSLHYMSAILKAVEDGYSEALLDISACEADSSGHWLVAPGLLHLHDNQLVGWFTHWLETSLPRKLLGRRWRARLHISAANATLGWLKYARSVKTKHAWLAIFTAAMYHLERGRRLLEDEPPA